MKKEPNISALIKKFINNECTPLESEQVLEWLAAEDFEIEQKELIYQVLQSKPDSSLRSEELQKKLDDALNIISDKVEKDIINSRKIKRKHSYYWAAAASIILLFISTLFILQPKQNHPELTVTKKIVPVNVNNHGAPGGNKAVLTLASGQKIILQDAANGNVAQQGNTKIIKLNDRLTYSQGGNTNDIVYNIITTPKSGQYMIVLSDDSKIWLNAASSVRFPTAFQNKERRVEITGEVYFEIAKDASRPFKVSFSHAGKMGEITVMGTHFNVMCYADEDAVKTTLLEGSVKIDENKYTTLLVPGQQAVLNKNSVKVLSGVDVQEVVAWKNGYFQFNSATLQEVLRQIGRWYDLDVSYEGIPTDQKFNGKISRDNNLSEIIKVLELTKVKLKIENRKIIVQ